MKRNIKKLHLGAGKTPLKGYITVDKYKLPGIDVVFDLNKSPWPFRNNEFNEVYVGNVLQYLNNVDNSMEELHRITSPHGIVRILVPYYNSHVANFEYYHIHRFSYFSFDHFLLDNPKNYYSKVKFKMIKRKTVASLPFKWIPDISLPFAKSVTLRVLLSYYIPNLIVWVEFIMQPIKNDRT